MELAQIKKEIHYHHTDAGGVVYYANYLAFFEEARTELFRSKGLNVKTMAKSGTMFVVCRQEVDYKYPGFYGDELLIEAEITKIQAVRIEFEQSVRNQDGVLLCRGKTIMACVDGQLRPQAIPGDIKDKLES
jgi:acyl-CoA thioester hydrolase